MPIEATETAITRDPIVVDLALHGGGSHGAFTWGVLDGLLEEPWLGIDGISGTSAGAMNAAVLVDGHAKGGAEGAGPLWRISGAASPRRRASVLCGADRSMCFWPLDTGLFAYLCRHGSSCLACCRPMT